MKKLIGIYKELDEALRMIEELKGTGYDEEHIAVVAKHIKEYEVLHPKLTEISGESEVAGPSGLDTYTPVHPEDLGADISGFGAFADSGFGPILGSGPIAERLAEKGVSESTLVHILEEYGMTPEEAATYEHRIHDGEIMILVDNG